MKILKALAIAYLVWALLYSLTGGRAWARDALAFKFNSGPQLVSQLEGDGFKVTGTQVEVASKFMALSLSTREIRNGPLDYHWGGNASMQAMRTLEGYRKQQFKPEEFRNSVRLEKDWAIWAGLNEAPSSKFSVIKKAVDNLKIDPKETHWYPGLELRFLFRLLSAQLGSDWLVPEVFLPLVMIFRLIFIFPVLLLFVAAAALSPPQIAPVTAYLPIAIYALLLFLLTRRSKTK